MAKDEILLEPETHYLVIKGVKYQHVTEKRSKLKGHAGNLVFKPINEEQYNTRISKVASYLSENLDNLNVDLILEETLKKLSVKEFERIERKTFKRNRPKLEKGCLAINIGGQILQVID